MFLIAGRGGELGEAQASSARPPAKPAQKRKKMTPHPLHSMNELAATLLNLRLGAKPNPLHLPAPWP